ncbi:MAG: PP2C family protein-serine/threonine phosphatase [Candidatus Hydrogenedentales bacterium]
MHFVDLSHDPMLPVFMEMGRKLSLTSDPDEVLHITIDAFRRDPAGGPYVHALCHDLPRGHYRLAPTDPITGLETTPPSRLFQEMHNFPVHTSGIISELIRTPEPKLAIDVYLRNDPVLGDRFAPFQSMAATPMYEDGQQKNWVIAFFNDSRENPERMADAVLRINMLMSNIRAGLLMQELKQAKTWIDQELENIRNIQAALLPPAIPAIPGIQGAANYETFDRAGGDYYDFLPLERTNGRNDPQGPWALIIADASGHGPAAAVVMAMLHSLFHSYAGPVDSPAGMLEHFNENLQSARIRHAFVTAFLGVYHPRTGELRFANAGHEPPLLMTPGAPNPLARVNTKQGFPLGVASRADVVDASTQLEPGQTLVLYTDGITDAMNADRQRFTIEGIEQALFECSGEPFCVIENVRDALLDHEAGVRANDDQTIVALRAEPR